MTGGLQGSGEEDVEEPVISIQPDWEDSLFSQKKEVWISCKFRGKDSIHSKLRFHDGSKFTSDGFTVTSFKRNSLSLRHDESGYSSTFVPPHQIYPNIHTKKIVSLDVADNELAVSVCSDNNLLVWNTKSGQVLRTLAGHVVNVYKCKFFPSGIVVLSGGADMQLKIWCAKTGINPVTLVGHKAAINDFCIVDRGRNIISASKDGTARLWDCGKSECLGVIFQSSDVLNCCSIGVKADIVTDGREVTVSEREIGTKDKLLLIGSEEGFVYGVAVFIRKVIFTLNMESAVNVILLNKDRFAVGCQNGKIDIFELKSDVTKVNTYFMSNSSVISGCLYKENSFIVGRNDGTVSCFEFCSKTRKCITLTGSDCDPVYSICTVKDEIFTACRDSKIRKYIIDDKN